MLWAKHTSKKKKLTVNDPVYSGRDFTSIWSYVLKHGSKIDNFFKGIDIPKERILDENEWFDIHTTIKLWDNYRTCLPDYDMTETFQLYYETTRNSSFGIAKLFTQFSSIKLIMKLFPYLAATVSKIDLFKTLELKSTSAVIAYNIYPGFEDFIDSSHMYSFMGLFTAVPTIHNRPPARVREVASLIDVFKKFNVDFAQFNHSIEEKNGIIYLDNAPAGKWITITKDQDLDPIVHKYLSGETCVLWEKDVKEKKKAGHSIYIAKKGDLYNCSQSIFSMEWEDIGFFARLKGTAPLFKQYLVAFFKTRDALFEQTSQLHDQADILQKRIKEKTDQVYKAQAEIHKLETNLMERRITGGFAHEMRNALAGAQIETQSILDFRSTGKPSPELLKQSASRLLQNIYEIHQEFDIPPEKIPSQIISELKFIVEISDHLLDTIPSISRDLDRGLRITQDIRNYSRLNENRPGHDLMNISLILKNYGQQYCKEFKKNGIGFSVKGDTDIIMAAGKGHLESIFSNLIINAKDALVEDGTMNPKISICIDRADGRIAVRVQDNGPGIIEKNLAEIFEPFFSTKPSMGTGLGLGIVKRLVNLYGGHINVESIPGKGSIFEVIFPDGSTAEDKNSLKTDGST